MSRQAREQSLSSWAPKSASNGFGRLQRQHSKTRHQPWMSGDKRKRTQYLWRKFTPLLDERTHELVPRWSVVPERVSCFAEVTFQHHRRPVIQRMSQGSG